MTDFDMQKAKEICEKATQGPWYKSTEEEYDADYEAADHLVGGPTGREVYDRDLGVFHVDGDDDFCVSICSPQEEADADFIVASRELLPAAIARIEELEADLTKSNHAYLDLQYICDEQAERISILENALIEERAKKIQYKLEWKQTHTLQEMADDVRKMVREQLVSEGLLTEDHANGQS
jgi:hypothetical protein